MILALRYVGIDVSKHMLDIFDDAVGDAQSIANAPQPPVLAVRQRIRRV
jgi:transposase